MSKAASKRGYKIGSTVEISTPWADDEFPNVRGTVQDFRHGGQIMVIATNQGRSPRCLHVSYLR